MSDTTTRPATREQVEQWLLGYAWMGTEEEQARNVACIMAQDGWRFVEDVADRFAGAQEEPGPAAFDEGYGFALSALYECHEGPHIDGCPSTAPDGPPPTAWDRPETEPCEKLTVGCSVRHPAGAETECEPW